MVEWLSTEDKDELVRALMCTGLSLSNSTSAELLAIQETCRLYYEPPWANSCNLILECDSSLAVDWLLFPHLVHEVFKPIVSSYLKLCTGLLSTHDASDTQRGILILESPLRGPIEEARRMASILKQLSSLLFIFKVYCHNNASLARSPFKDQESSLLKRPHHNARSFWTPMTDVAKYYPDCCDLQFCWKRLDNCVRNEVLSGFKEQRPWLSDGYGLARGCVVLFVESLWG
ncbi:hypothetical protein V6N13_020030 [Hibiscus sabdariffa]